jgi:hypothetical protein
VRHAYLSSWSPPIKDDICTTPVLLRRRKGAEEKEEEEKEELGSRVEELKVSPGAGSGSDPLRWFGVLTPPALKQAQVRVSTWNKNKLKGQ